MLEKIFGEIEDSSLVEIALTHPSYTKEQNLDSLLSYDVSIAKEEVERTKKLVKKMEIGVKKNG